MDQLLTALKIGAVLAGIVTPIVYRRMFGGPWRLSGDGSFLEMMGFLLSMMVTNPIGLLVALGASPFVSASEASIYASVTVLNFVLGIVGGWVWIVVFVRPIKPSKSPFST